MWACERGVFVNAGGLHSNSSFSGGGCSFSFLLLIVFLEFFARIAAMLMGFLILSCFRWYAHGFVTAFAYLDRFCCYAHLFFDLFSFLMVCSRAF